MDQTNKPGYSYKTTDSVGQAFYHSCLGKLVILTGVIIVLLIVATLTKPSSDTMTEETVDNILECIEANDSIKGDKIDDAVNNIGFIFSKADTANIIKDLREALHKYNRLEIYNHTFFRTAYIHNNIYPEGTRAGIGIYGIVIPTVLFSDLLLQTGPMHKGYDHVIKSTITIDRDLGTNPNIKEFHYKGNPDD